MKTALLAGSASLTANLLILSAFIPLAIGFRPMIVLQIAFWTFFAAIGAAATMVIVQKFSAHPTYVFAVLACVVFLLSLIPIYLQVGILQQFPPSLLLAITSAITTMHIADSLTISALVIALV